MTSKWIKASVAAAALLVTPFAASAADVRVPRDSKVPYYKGPTPSVIAYYNWTGFYIGATVGYGTGTSDWDVPAVSMSPKGMMYGGTVGYNWQAGSFVYGLEADYSASNVNASLANCGGVPGLTCETENTWLATFRGRFGYAFDRFLPYVTGGGAYGNIRASLTPPGITSSESKFGYTLGAGLEYAFLGNWTAKIEYLYVDLGSFDTAFIAPAVTNVSFSENVIRVGLNYKFGGPVFSRW